MKVIEPVVPFANEPHPDTFEWNAWFVKRFYSKSEYLDANQIAFMRAYRLETRARWVQK